jgi:hypothetical protein
MAELDRKNEKDIIQIWGELKLINQKVDSLKDNDLFHVQKSIDGIYRFLWGLSGGLALMVLSQLPAAIRSIFLG